MFQRLQPGQDQCSDASDEAAVVAAVTRAEIGHLPADAQQQFEVPAARRLLGGESQIESTQGTGRRVLRDLGFEETSAASRTFPFAQRLGEGSGDTADDTG